MIYLPCLRILSTHVFVSVIRFRWLKHDEKSLSGSKQQLRFAKVYKTMRVSIEQERGGNIDPALRDAFLAFTVY